MMKCVTSVFKEKKVEDGIPLSREEIYWRVDGSDKSISRDGIVASFEKFGQVIHTANRPLPTGAGDASYMEDSKYGGILGDLKALCMKDLETANTLLKQHLTGTELTDDKTVIMEKTIQLVSNLPEDALNQVKLTNTFLWALFGIYLVILRNHSSVTGTTVVKLLNRTTTFSFRNGKAWTPYTWSVLPLTIQPNPKLDPGLIFDTIMIRENGGFRPHPNKISSILYCISSIIIHDYFRTSHTNFNIYL